MFNPLLIQSHLATIINMNTQEKNRNQMIISSSSIAGIVLLSLVMSISLLLEQVFAVYAIENQDTPSVLQTQKIQLMQQNQSNSSNLSAQILHPCKFHLCRQVLQMS